MSNEPQKLPHPAASNPLDKIEMLSQPLLTELGTINPACMQELEAALKKIPPLHERAADDPEWSTKAWTTENDILRGFCGYAVSFWEGPALPPAFDLVVGFVRAGLRKAMRNFSGVWMAELSLCDIHRLLYDLLSDLEPFKAWDEHFSTSALLNMTCNHVRNERRHDLAFDIAFWREHGCSPTHGGMGDR